MVKDLVHCTKFMETFSCKEVSSQPISDLFSDRLNFLMVLVFISLGGFISETNLSFGLRN